MALPKSPSEILVDSEDGTRHVDATCDDLDTIMAASFLIRYAAFFNHMSLVTGRPYAVSTFAHTGTLSRPLSEINCEQFARDVDFLLHHGAFGRYFPNSGLAIETAKPELITKILTSLYTTTPPKPRRKSSVVLWDDQRIPSRLRFGDCGKNALQICFKTPKTDWLTVDTFHFEPDQEDAMKKLVEAVEKAIAKPQ
jgi:hypothetical protein